MAQKENVIITVEAKTGDSAKDVGNLKDKIDEVLFMTTILERIPTKFFKSVTGIKGLFEIRIEYESNIYRIFCCFYNFSS